MDEFSNRSMSNPSATFPGAISSQKTTKQIMITRRLFVQISGTIQRFAQLGSTCATWQPANGKIGEVFGINDLLQHDNPGNKTTSEMLQNAILHKITILDQKNEFPVDLGVRITCIPNEELTANGNAFAITSPAQSYNTTPCVVFCADTDSAESAQWRSEYPAYNATNLEVHGILQVGPQQDYLFVHQHHPVIQVLRINKELINADIDAAKKLEDEWFKVTKAVFSHCCQELRQRVLNKVSTRDLNSFSIQIARIGSDGWNSSASLMNELRRAMPEHEVSSKSEEEVQKYMTSLISKQSSYSARLELQYELQV